MQDFADLIEEDWENNSATGGDMKDSDTSVVTTYQADGDTGLIYSGQSVVYYCEQSVTNQLNQNAPTDEYYEYMTRFKLKEKDENGIEAVDEDKQVLYLME